MDNAPPAAGIPVAPGGLETSVAVGHRYRRRPPRTAAAIRGLLIMRKQPVDKNGLRER